MQGLKEIWRNGGTTLGAWLTVPGSVPAEAAARGGVGYVCVDMQHAVQYSDAVAMIQGILLGGSHPIVRVPWNEPGIIGKMLDAGAHGIIVPMVNSVEEARRAAAACRYAPLGQRSFGAFRASMTRGSDTTRANERTICFVMIESEAGLRDADAIAAVPGRTG